MKHFKVSITITCENSTIESRIYKVTRDALNFCGCVDFVMVEDRR